MTSRNRKSTKTGTPWTTSEVNYISRYAGKKTVSEMAANLGRTSKAVSRKAEKIGISVRIYN